MNSSNSFSISFSPEEIFDYSNKEVSKLNEIKIVGSENLFKMINVSFNNLKDIDFNFIEKFPNSCYYDFSNNEISQLQELNYVSNYENIKYLDLSYNQIDNLNGLEQLQELERLTLSNNKLKQVALSKSMPKLEFLDVRHNQIENINFSYLFPKLHTLKIDNNEVKQINELSSFSELEVFSASSNRIIEIPFLNHTYIRTLNLAHNNITNLENLNCFTERLSILDISGNPINDYGMNCGIISTLKQLFLADTNISRCQPLSSLFPQLSVCIFCGSKLNNMDDITEFIKNMKNLMVFDIRFTPLTENIYEKDMDQEPTYESLEEYNKNHPFNSNARIQFRNKLIQSFVSPLQVLDHIKLEGNLERSLIPPIESNDEKISPPYNIANNEPDSNSRSNDSQVKIFFNLHSSPNTKSDQQNSTNNYSNENNKDIFDQENILLPKKQNSLIIQNGEVPSFPIETNHININDFSRANNYYPYINQSNNSEEEDDYYYYYEDDLTTTNIIAQTLLHQKNMKNNGKSFNKQIKDLNQSVQAEIESINQEKRKRHNEKRMLLSQLKEQNMLLENEISEMNQNYSYSHFPKRNDEKYSDANKNHAKNRKKSKSKLKKEKEKQPTSKTRKEIKHLYNSNKDDVPTVLEKDKYRNVIDLIDGLLAENQYINGTINEAIQQAKQLSPRTSTPNKRHVSLMKNKKSHPSLTSSKHSKNIAPHKNSSKSSNTQAAISQLNESPIQPKRTPSSKNKNIDKSQDSSISIDEYSSSSFSINEDTTPSISINEDNSPLPLLIRENAEEKLIKLLKSRKSSNFDGSSLEFKYLKLWLLKGFPKLCEEFIISKAKKNQNQNNIYNFFQQFKNIELFIMLGNQPLNELPLANSEFFKYFNYIFKSMDSSLTICAIDAGKTRRLHNKPSQRKQKSLQSKGYNSICYQRNGQPRIIMLDSERILPLYALFFNNII